MQTELLYCLISNFGHCIHLFASNEKLPYSFSSSSFSPAANSLGYKIITNCIFSIYLGTQHHEMVNWRLFWQTLVFWSKVNYGEQLRKSRLSHQIELINRHSGNALRFIHVFEKTKHFISIFIIFTQLHFVEFIFTHFLIKSPGGTLCTN